MLRKSSPLLLLDVLAFRVELVHIPAINWQHCIANDAHRVARQSARVRALTRFALWFWA